MRWRVVLRCQRQSRNARCRECIVPGTDPCDGITCNAPPADACEGNTALSYAQTGTCDAGDCTYTQTQTDCGGSATCEAGICVDNADPCSGVVCNDIPDDYCTGDVGTVYSSGICSNGNLYLRLGRHRLLGVRSDFVMRAFVSVRRLRTTL